MLIRSVTANGFGPLVGRNVIEFAPGRTVIHGRNGTGKSVLFRGMRGWFHGVSDVSSLPGWFTNAADPRGVWSDVGRVLVEVEGEEDDTCTFLDDELIAHLDHGYPGISVTDDDAYEMLRLRFTRRLERMAGDDLRRRGRIPRLVRIEGLPILAGLHYTPSGLRTLTALALALAIRDVRSPRTPLIIDDGGLGLLDREHRWRVAQELTGLEGQVILFTSVADVAQQVGVDWVLAPFRHAQGIRARRSTPRR